MVSSAFKMKEAKGFAVDIQNNLYPIEIDKSAMGNIVCLRALLNNQEVGKFNFSPFKIDGKDGFRLGLLKSHLSGQGVARALVKEFVSLVGKEIPVSAVITNKETREFLKSIDENSGRKKVEIVEMTDFEQLKQLPIVRVFFSGGIKAEKVTVCYCPLEIDNDSIVAIDFLGITH